MAENRFTKYVEQQGPEVTPLPMSPQTQAREARDTAAAERDDIRTGIAVRDEARGVDYKERDYAMDLRSKFDATPPVSNYREAIPLFVQGLKSANTPQGSNALIYAYAKVMDPGSVVRETEAEGVANSDTIFGRAYAYAQKQLDGQGTFSPEAREGLLREMRSKMIQLVQSYDAERDRYRADAQAWGIDPERVIGQHAAAPFVDELRAADERADDPRSAATTGAANLSDESGLSSPDEDPRGSPRDSLFGQGISGVNEGIASTLGFPVDAMTWAMNLVPRGINAAANTEIPQITDPFMGGGWWNDKMQDWAIFEPTDDPAAQFARRVGQSVGAASVPLMGTAGTVGNVGRGMLAATAGGVGAATAQQVAPGNVGAEIAAELLASGGVGLGAAAASRHGAQRAIEEAIPTVPQLKEQASDLYRQAEATGATASPAQTLELADLLRDTLRTEGRVSPTGRVSEVYPKTREAMQLVEDYSGQPMSPTQAQTVRGVIADGLQSPESSERRIARLLMDEFDDFVEPLVPGLAPAREMASRYLTAETLEQARELAGARAGQFTGSGFENALRTEYRALDRALIKGREQFSDPLVEAVENVARGTPGANAARAVGRFAPTGVLSSGVSFGVPFAVGNAVGGPALGTALGVGATAAGWGGREIATQMGIRNAARAELIARNGGPLPEAALMTPETERMIAALLASQTANQFGEDEIGQPGY
jgi:hypothetical protein